MHLSPAELTDVIGQFQAMENAIRGAKLAALSAYDKKEAWKPDGATSMAAWMVGMLGFGRDTANEETRVARAFEELPVIGESFRTGELSWDQARAVSEFATPETDKHFAAEARKFSAPHLRRMAKRFKPIADDIARDAINGRSLKMWWDVERNLLRLKGQLPAAEGALVEKALDRILLHVADDGPMPEGYDHNRLRADALVELAATRLDADPDRERATLGVHVDAAVLAGGKGMAELDCGQSLAMETAKRLACDSRWYIVVDGPAGLPVGIGRVSRQIPPWMVREVRHRDGGCRFPGCNRRGWTNIHHLVAWSEGGPTDMDNLCMLCGVHHRLVHEGGWKIVGDPNGQITFVDKTGRPFVQGPAPLSEKYQQRIATLTGEEPAEGGPAP